MRVAIVVPTLNAGLVWGEWIVALNRAGVVTDDVYVIDSGSVDSTVLSAVSAGFNIKKIPSHDFNHGSTRQLAVDALDGYDVVVFMTQDAILSSRDAVDCLLKGFLDDRVAAVCGRQLPRFGATSIEAHLRLYNYSSESNVRSIEDVPKLGIKTAFLSNSFAAYRISALTEVGGFPDNVIFGEDMSIATKLLMSGYQIAYMADACVYHSHSYTFWQEMQRYFDMGVFHAREPWIRQELGSAEGEGVKFVLSEVKYLRKHTPWKIPEGMIRTLVRYSGFRLGLLERWVPVALKKRLAMNKAYFK